MENAISAVVKKIPKGKIFDSHFVINQMIQHHSDAYLSFAGEVKTAKGKTLAMHGLIGKEINKTEGLEQIGSSWSGNIHNEPSECMAWRKK